MDGPLDVLPVRLGDNFPLVLLNSFLGFWTRKTPWRCSNHDKT